MTHPDQCTFPACSDSTGPEYGLTKREFFAAMCVAGMMADPSRNGAYSVYAKEAVAATDALIDALNAKPDGGKEAK